MKVIYLGKIKTFFQMFAIALLLMIDSRYETGLFILAEGVLLLSVIMGYLSLWAYLQSLNNVIYGWVAEWLCSDCKSVNAGSIPTSASLH